MTRLRVARVVEVEEAKVMVRRDAPEHVAADPRLVAAVAESLVEVDLGIVRRLAVEARLDVGAEDEAADVADDRAVEQGLGRPAGLGTGAVREAGGEQCAHGQRNERNCPLCLHRVVTPQCIWIQPRAGALAVLPRLSSKMVARTCLLGQENAPSGAIACGAIGAAQDDRCRGKVPILRATSRTSMPCG